MPFLLLPPLVFMEVEWHASGFSVQEHGRNPKSNPQDWASPFLAYLVVLRICPSSRISGDGELEELEDCVLKERLPSVNDCMPGCLIHGRLASWSLSGGFGLELACKRTGGAWE